MFDYENDKPATYLMLDLLVVVILGRRGRRRRLGLAAALWGRRFEGESPLELVDVAPVNDVDLWLPRGVLVRPALPLD